jgi:hypothetical protein
MTYLAPRTRAAQVARQRPATALAALAGGGLVTMLGLATLLGLGACQKVAILPPLSPTTPAAVSPSPTAIGGPSESASPIVSATEPATVFQADGIGPYLVRAELADLNARGLITKIIESPFCADASAADATGGYAGRITVSFRNGRLTAVHTTAADYATPSGARVGMTIEAIRAIYGSRGELITGVLGNQALVVRVPATGLAIVFSLDPTKTKIDAMSAGEAQALVDAVRNGEGC